MTMKGAGSSRVSFSMLTWPSLIASSRLLCVLGVARLISSARMMLLKTGPRRNSNSCVLWLKMLTPRMSLGSRSEVNWMRRKVLLIDWASECASTVLPTPGTSSISRCPRASRVTRAISTASVLPLTTISMLATASAILATASSLVNLEFS